MVRPANIAAMGALLKTPNTLRMARTCRSNPLCKVNEQWYLVDDDVHRLTSHLPESAT